MMRCVSFMYFIVFLGFCWPCPWQAAMHPVTWQEKSWWVMVNSWILRSRYINPIIKYMKCTVAACHYRSYTAQRMAWIEFATDLHRLTDLMAPRIIQDLCTKVSTSRHPNLPRSDSHPWCPLVSQEVIWSLELEVPAQMMGMVLPFACLLCTGGVAFRASWRRCR